MSSDAKIIVFAKGWVGERILRFFVRQDPKNLAGVVAVSNEDDCRKYVAPFIDPSQIFVWNDLRGNGDLERLKGLRADVFLLAWWPYILKDNLLGLGQKFTLNMHPSFLPYARGKDPNFWTIVEESPFGVSIHHVEPHVDAGAIAFQRQIPACWEDTGESLYRRAQETLVELF